jgi:hypothetical protein
MLAKRVKNSPNLSPRSRGAFLRLRRTAPGLRVVFATLAAGLVVDVGETPAATPAFTSASSAATSAPAQSLAIDRPVGAAAGQVLAGGATGAVGAIVAYAGVDPIQPVDTAVGRP